MKDVLTSEPILRFYDSEREIKISADASKSGLGAVILQKHENNKWFPVAYASRALTPAETHYAQIEKEMLAITFACERFRQYIYGQRIQVETDHKPLIAIFRKSLNDCPMRIQRLMLRLQKYSLEVSFTQGKFMYTSDALSRAYDLTMIPEDHSGEAEVDAYVDFIMHSIPVSDRKMEEIRLETSKDQELQSLIETIASGFPDCKSQCSANVLEYWNIKDELSVGDGIILRNNRVVIPRSLRKDMLTKIHSGHLGVAKCRLRARQVMYWPGMNQCVEEMVLSCSTCTKYRSKQASKPLKPHPVVEYPWEKVGVDICTLKGDNFLVICDYYSKYPEVCPLRSLNATAVIKAMKYIFAGQGVPKEERL